MKTLVSLLSLTLLGNLCFAQTPVQPDEADLFFSRNKFSAAWPYYEKQLQADSLNSELNYKMGVCYLNSRSQKDKAVPHLLKALAAKPTGNNGILTYKLLAEACCLTYRYEQAYTYYEKYQKLLLESQSPDQTALREVEKQMEICRLGRQLNELRELNTSLLNTRATVPGAGCTYTCADYTTSCSEDNQFMTFTFRRSFAPGNLYQKDLFDDKVLNPGRDTTLTDTRDTTHIRNEATVGTSVDGQIILTYRDDNGDANLYVSTLNGNEWTTPMRLNKSLNTQGWEPNEFISPDGAMMFFTSSREGGLGGKDIYVSMKGANGEWGRAVNLGYPINTPYDDEAPFIFPDGKTFYFSSNRLRKNSFDIFSATFISGQWSAPVNVGYPLNKKNERPNADLPGAHANEKDNCLVTFFSPQKVPLVMIKGVIVGRNNAAPPGVEITVSDNATGEVTGVYNASRGGNYALLLPSGRNNNLRFEADGYLFHSENLNISEGDNFYALTVPVELQPLAENSSTVLNNIFFKRQEPQLETDSQSEIDLVFHLLADHPGMVIELAAYGSDPKKKEPSTQKLREEKVRRLCETLMGRGIDRERIHTRVYAKSEKRRKHKHHNNAESVDKEYIALKILKLNNLK